MRIDFGVQLRDVPLDQLRQLMDLHGIDVVVASDPGTADYGFAASDAGLPVIWGGRIQATGGVIVQVIGAVDKVIVPSGVSTQQLLSIVHHHQGAVAIIQGGNPLERSGMDGSFVYFDGHFIGTSKSICSLTGSGHIDNFGRCYTELDADSVTMDELVHILRFEPHRFQTRVLF